MRCNTCTIMLLFCCIGIHRMINDYYSSSPVWIKLLSEYWIASQLSGGDKPTNLAALVLLCTRDEACNFFYTFLRLVCL